MVLVVLLVGGLVVLAFAVFEEVTGFIFVELEFIVVVFVAFVVFVVPLVITEALPLVVSAVRLLAITGQVPQPAAVQLTHEPEQKLHLPKHSS